MPLSTEIKEMIKSAVSKKDEKSESGEPTSSIQEVSPFPVSKIPSEEEAIDLMKNMGLLEKIIEHAKIVMKEAESIAQDIKNVDINFNLVKIGALLHDIGRTQSHDINHGEVGGNLCRKLNLPEELARVVETHVMGGLKPKEAASFGLNARSFLPETIEEKVVCLADKRVSGINKVLIEERFEKWFLRYGKTEFLKAQIDRVKELQLFILSLIN